MNLPLPDAVRMASANPAEFLALRDVGRIAAGQRANLVLLDDDLQVRETWIDGVSDQHTPAVAALI
jgi:N-acetylglucosamine-6-phosphate deacetylase